MLYIIWFKGSGYAAEVKADGVSAENGFVTFTQSFSTGEKIEGNDVMDWRPVFTANLAEVSAWYPSTPGIRIKQLGQ